MSRDTGGVERRSLDAAGRDAEIVSAETTGTGVSSRDRRRLGRPGDPSLRYEPPSDEGQDARDFEETRQTAAVELGGVLYSRGDYGGALRTVGPRTIDEPLDQAILRGCCEARRGKRGNAADDWAKLVPRLRAVATALNENGAADDGALLNAHGRLSALSTAIVAAGGAEPPAPGDADAERPSPRRGDRRAFEKMHHSA